MEAQIFENYIKKIFSEKISWACVLTATLHMVLPFAEVIYLGERFTLYGSHYCISPIRLFQGRRLCSLTPHMFLNSKQSQSAVRELHERCSSLTRVSRLLCTKVNASTHTDKFVYRLVLGSVSSCSVCFGIPRVFGNSKTGTEFPVSMISFPICHPLYYFNIFLFYFYSCLFVIYVFILITCYDFWPFYYFICWHFAYCPCCYLHEWTHISYVDKYHHANISRGCALNSFWMIRLTSTSETDPVPRTSKLS